jgi:hypothetical protein
MALVLRFSFAAQIITAFVIFVLGYIALFVSLLIALLAVRGLYEGAKWLRASVATRAMENRSAHSGGGGGERQIPFPSTQLARKGRVPNLLSTLLLTGAG